MKIDDEIDYAVVYKTCENAKIKKVEAHIFCGNKRHIQERLEKSVSNKVNASYIARSNGTLKLNNTLLQRKTYKFSEDMEFLNTKLSIIKLFYDFIKPHLTLSKNPEKAFISGTPAMVAGTVNRQWYTKFAFERPELI